MSETPLYSTLSSVISAFQSLATGFINVGGDVVTFITTHPLAMLGVLSWLAVTAFGFVTRLIKN